MMSNNHKLENQDLHPTTTGNNSDSANLPAEQLTEQDLDAVSGGNPLVSAPLNQALAVVVDESIQNRNPQMEELDGAAGAITDGVMEADTAIENIENGFESAF